MIKGSGQDVLRCASTGEYLVISSDVDTSLLDHDTGEADRKV